MINTLGVAVDYIARGWCPVPIPYMKKGPVGRGWQKLRITAEDAPKYFNGGEGNVGIILGEASGNLVDADLDCPEALALASSFLPLTDSAFGRPSKRRSHLLYTSAVPKVMAFEDPAGTNGHDKAEMLVELRSTGGQTVFPGSTHESGEVIRWAEDGDPAEVDPVQLIKAVSELAAACLLVRAAPAENRNRYMLEIAGALVRGLGADGAAHILAPVGRLVFGPLYSKAAEERLIADTARKIAEERPASGWPTLTKALGEKRARKVSDWLGLSTQEPFGEEQVEPIVGQTWPEPLGPDAYHGIVGNIVHRIEPETEADPAGLLFQLLAAAGNVLGAGAYARVEADKHPPRLWVTLVGRTSKGRKGTALGRIRELMSTVAPVWAQNCQGSGLSSGEGLISCVRDPIEQRVKEKNSKEYRVEIIDEGVADKRLLLIEAELAKALKSMDRPGNTLSAVLRDAWDHGNLRTLIKNNPHRATDAHVSLIAHVTDSELRRYLTGTEMANGFANRKLFVCVQRSKELPRGGRPINWNDIEDRLNKILAGKPFGEIRCTAAFWTLWEERYSALSADRPGLLGAILGRAEAQVLRMTLIYALLDRQEFMDAVHLRAALACWKYAEESARFIFGDALGDPVADEILRELRQRPDGMTREEIRQHFSGNQPSAEIGRALGVLATGNFASSTKEPTKGRPVERWHARK